MQAQIIHTWGGAERFEAATLPDPTPGPGEVLVQVAATSVNPADYKLRQAGPPIAPELPAVLGCDVAGRVLAVGDGVAGFAEGDEVYGCVGGVRGMPGCYAEMIAADARLLAPKPAVAHAARGSGPAAGHHHRVGGTRARRRASEGRRCWCTAAPAGSAGSHSDPAREGAGRRSRHHRLFGARRPRSHAASAPTTRSTIGTRIRR